MKIISIGSYNPLPINSGVDSYYYHLLNSLGKDNWVLHCYTLKLKSEKGYYPSNINFQTGYIKSKFSKKIERLPRNFRLIRPDLLIDRTSISGLEADLVMCCTFNYHIGKYISKKNKSPLILIKHNIEWEYLKSNGSLFYIPMKIYENNMLTKVDAITTISLRDHEYVSRNVSRERVFYVPPKVNSDIFKPEGSHHDFGSNKFNLLFYGSLDREQNITALQFIKNELISALKKEGLMQFVRINVFGSGKPPESLNLKNCKDINYFGAVEDPGRFIRGSDLVILPLKNIGGIKIRIVESFLCNKPAIATPEAAAGLPDELKRMVYIEAKLGDSLK